MDSQDVSNTSINSSLDNTQNTTLKAKVRRLKIQENLLIQNIKKYMPTDYDDIENNFLKSDLEFKKFLLSIKKAYSETKQLFEDVKCTVKSQDILKSLDIDDIKKDVLNLEDKIKYFKTHLQNELTDLKKSEKDLLKQLEDDPGQDTKMKKVPKLLTKTYSDIIPSPVKNLINSPLKCSEVQQFQDFIKSTNKYGGWNEYHHNIFVRIWLRHFHGYEEDITDIEQINCNLKNCFTDEVFEKIAGINRKDIISHMEWYSKYLYLKKRQQNALDEWRAKTKPNKIYKKASSHVKASTKSFNAHQHRQKIGRIVDKYDERSIESFSDDSIVYSPNIDEQKLYSCVDANEFFKEMGKIDYTQHNSGKISADFRFAKPTKQWENRCNSTTDERTFNRNIENIKKLGIPSWRIGLVKEK